MHMYAIVHVYLYIWMMEVVTECLPQLLSICDVVCCVVCVCVCCMYTFMSACIWAYVCACLHVEA